jgi:hypothetical protein
MTRLPERPDLPKVQLIFTGAGPYFLFPPPPYALRVIDLGNCATLEELQAAVKREITAERTWAGWIAKK